MKQNRTAWSASFLAVAVLGDVGRLAYATYPDHNGLITFSADTGSGSPIYAVRPNRQDRWQWTNPDGSDLHRIIGPW